MLPIPSHLEKILIPVGRQNNDNQINGVIRCSCGYSCFHIKIYANTENGYPQVCGYGDDYALVIKAVCGNCGKAHLIFDDSKHGWNGFVCHDGVSVREDELKSWNCPVCNRNIHKINISIWSQGKDDFVNECGIADGETEFHESDWVNAFEWITMGLRCLECGHDDDKWLDYETM